MLMDKAGWHTAGDLALPENLSLAFLPPYSPESSDCGCIFETIVFALRLPHHRRYDRQLLHRLELAACRRSRPYPIAVLLAQMCQ
jgi:transposase